MLSFCNVTVARGLRVLVQGAHFDLPPGAFWVLHGSNGAGKTTLLHAAAGLVDPLTGRVRRAAPAAFLGHDLALKDLLPVRHYVTQHRLRPEAWGLEGLLDLPISHLSAGQKKRVALARAFEGARPPKPLWLLDEPLANLDATMEATALAAIARHCAAGGAVLATAHKTLACDRSLHIIERQLELRHG